MPRPFTFRNQGFTPVTDNFVFPSGAATVYGNLATWETGLVGGQEYPAQDLFHPPQDRGFHGRWTIRLRADDTLRHQAVSTPKLIICPGATNPHRGLYSSQNAP